ncbi:phosphoglycerate dehydrogenase [Oscillospiraceae bacterium MB08-C2-2]|nr:phosphoglycerate dehydrogenase [Oscillospiraceae bacterium MB08-C2-2]
MSKNVLVTATGYSIYCQKAKQLLEQNGVNVIENPHGRPFTQEELLQVVGDIDGVVAGVDTWDETIFQKAPRLKVIARFGVGVDNIDLQSAAAHGIAVSNARGMNSGSVAEMAIALMLSCLRNVPNLNRSTREGAWERFMGRDLTGMCVGLLGFGDIARKVAKKLSGFDVKLIAYDLYPNMELAKELNTEMVSMDEVLAKADIVSMHLPSLPETQHIMNAETFAKMKPGSVFINTARGALVDESALFNALTGGRLLAAASDVYESEPAGTENPLFELDTFIATPHTAAETYATCENVGLMTAQALLDVFNGKNPENRLN